MPLTVGLTGTAVNAPDQGGASPPDSGSGRGGDHRNATLGTGLVDQRRDLLFHFPDPAGHFHLVGGVGLLGKEQPVEEKRLFVFVQLTVTLGDVEDQRRMAFVGHRFFVLGKRLAELPLLVECLASLEMFSACKNRLPAP